MKYRTQKILLTGKISEELRDYFVWLCHQSNNLYNSALYQVRQAHFESCPTYEYFDDNQMYRTAYKDRLVKAGYAQVGIVFTETEEAYTSKSSFLDNDLVPKYGEKPKGYRFLGKRVKRGLYRTAKGWLINADCNGAASILRKVATQLGINLVEVGKAALTLPKRYHLHLMRRSYRKNGETCLQTVSE